MAVKPVDRIRTMITDLERGARTLGDDIRKRAGNVAVTSELETALRQLLHGLTTIAVQLEKAAGELRRYLEDAGTATSKKKARKPAGKRKAVAKKAAAPKAAKTDKKKAAPKKAGGKAKAPKAPKAEKKVAKADTKKAPKAAKAVAKKAGR